MSETSTERVAKRRLGRTGLEVSEVGYGSWGIGGGQWRGGTDDEALKALHRALDLGVDFIDTALAYGDGHSEQLVGRVLRERPGEAFVATKIPPQNRRWPGDPRDSVEDVFPKDYVIACTERSLRNLDVDAIDVQQLHVWHDAWVGGTWHEAAEQLKQEGKVRHFGVSVGLPQTALEVVRSGTVDTVQVVYNVITADADEALLPLCASEDVGVIARVPFDEGSLAGAVQPETQFEQGDWRNDYFTPEMRADRWVRVQGILRDLGIELEDLPAIALRFCLARPEVSTVIPGMRRVEHVEANVRAAQAGPLELETLEVLANYRLAL
jgi:aryl-alcohol dehydrogenase-like predicted oxidoreductase